MLRDLLEKEQEFVSDLRGLLNQYLQPLHHADMWVGFVLNFISWYLTCTTDRKQDILKSGTHHQKDNLSRIALTEWILRFCPFRHCLLSCAKTRRNRLDLTGTGEETSIIGWRLDLWYTCESVKFVLFCRKIKNKKICWVAPTGWFF